MLLNLEKINFPEGAGDGFPLEYRSALFALC